MDLRRTLGIGSHLFALVLLACTQFEGKECSVLVVLILTTGRSSVVPHAECGSVVSHLCDVSVTRRSQFQALCHLPTWRSLNSIICMASSAKFASSCLENNENYSFHITANWPTKLCTLGRPEMTPFSSLFYFDWQRLFVVVISCSSSKTKNERRRRKKEEIKASLMDRPPE